MKIAQVNVYFKPFMVGGAEWYVYNISKQLVKMGHEVHVFTVNRYNGETASSLQEMEGIRVHRIPLRIDWSYRIKVWNSSLHRSLRSDKFDIIHTYDYPQWHSRTALKVAKETRTGSILTVFDVHSMIPRSLYKQLPLRFFDAYFARRILNSADRVLVRAPNLAVRLEEMGVAKETMIVTPSGINDEALGGGFDGKRFRQKFQLSGSPLILCLSRLNPLKGPQHLIAAMPAILQKFSNADVVFVGPDQSGYTVYLRGLAKKIGVEKHVHFTGPIYDFNEKMDAYESCDVFALPSTYEGTSQAIFEAMARGKPIVSTQTGGIPYQIRNQKDGILVPYDEIRIQGLLSDAIIRILQDKAFGKELGLNARKTVEAFRYSILCDNLSKIYDEVTRIRSNTIRV